MIIRISVCYTQRVGKRIQSGQRKSKKILDCLDLLESSFGGVAGVSTVDTTEADILMKPVD